MKKLIVVAYQQHTGRQYAETLQTLFGNSVEVTFYSMYSGRLKNLDADIILASTYSVCELLEQYVPNFANIIIANITLRKESLEQLRAVPQNYSCELAVTPGEPDLVPPGIGQVIDLGDRVLSTRTITEIAIQLGMGDVLNKPKFQQYFDSLLPTIWENQSPAAIKDKVIRHNSNVLIASVHPT